MMSHTPPSYRRHFYSSRIFKILPFCILAASSMPAYSIWLDTPNVRDGLSLGIFTTVNPTLSSTSNTFSYTLADPSLYDTKDAQGQVIKGKLEDMAADIDRQDADRRLRADGVNDAFIQFYGTQVLTKDVKLSGSIAVGYDKDSYHNHGALWGVGVTIKDDLEITVGDKYTRLPVRQTDVNNIVQDSGTHVAVESTHIPNLTLSGYHMFVASADVNNPKKGGWHRSNGVSAKYELDFSPRNKMTVAVGGTLSKGHDKPFYVNTASKGESYMGSVGYRYKDLNVAVDYGQAKKQYNGAWADTIKSTVYGVKATYDITPRLKGTLSYAHKTDDNTKPIDLKFIIERGFGVDNDAAFAVFDKIKQDRYKAGLDYKLYKGVTLTASVEDTRTRNYVAEGEFSKRRALTTSVGASLSF